MAKRKVSQTTGQLGQRNMYISPSFDTHKIVKSFTAAGMKEPQAEAVVAIVESRDNDLSRLSTKEQLEGTKDQIKELQDQLESFKEAIKEEFKVVRDEFKSEFKAVREEMKLYVTKEHFEIKLESSISRLEASLLKWLVATAITMTGVISGIVIAAVKFIH